MPTVFYAWQSDRNPHICRYLIRDATKAALKKLKREPDIFNAPSFQLDQDRQGVPGHPHIASVIRKKIKACDVFLADLSQVAAYVTHDKRIKGAQNPNVLIELGIAIRAKGFERLILAMNTAFGPPENLPFDLKSHSFPIIYELPDTSDPQRLKDVRLKLADDIAHALKPMLTDIVAKATEGEVVSGRDLAEQRSRDFYSRFEEGSFHGLNSDNIPMIVAMGTPSPPEPRQAFLLLSTVPLKRPDLPLDIAAFEQQIPSIFRPIDPSEGWFADGYGTRIIVRDGPRGGVHVRKAFPTSAVELNDDGSIFAAKRMLAWPSRWDDHDVVNLEMFERPMLWQLAHYVIVLRERKVSGPLEVRVRLDGLSDAYIRRSDMTNVDTGRVRTIREGPIMLNPVTLSPKFDGNSVSEVAEAMRPSLAVIWRDAGYTGDPCFDLSHKFIGKASP